MDNNKIKIAVKNIISCPIRGLFNDDVDKYTQELSKVIEKGVISIIAEKYSLKYEELQEQFPISITLGQYELSGKIDYISLKKQIFFEVKAKKPKEWNDRLIGNHQGFIIEANDKDRDKFLTAPQIDQIKIYSSMLKAITGVKFKAVAVVYLPGLTKQERIAFLELNFRDDELYDMQQIWRRVKDFLLASQNKFDGLKPWIEDMCHFYGKCKHMDYCAIHHKVCVKCAKNGSAL